MANPVITLYKSDDTTQITDNAPNEWGTVFTGNSGGPIELHIWNDIGGSLGSTPAYNVKVKIVTATGVDTGDTVADGQEIVTNKWIGIKSITNNETTYTQVGNGEMKSLGTINPNTKHTISCIAVVPNDASPAPSGTPNNNITFEIQVLYTLSE